MYSYCVPPLQTELAEVIEIHWNGSDYSAWYEFHGYALHPYAHNITFQK